MNDPILVALIAGGVSLTVTLIGILANVLYRRSDRKDKSRDSLETRVQQAEQKGEAATVKQFDLMEANRISLLKADAECSEKVRVVQVRTDALEVKVDDLTDFITVFIRAVRNNVAPEVFIKIREEIDSAGVKWPVR